MATILLIEDNVPLADVMTQALKSAGHDVLRAATGREGTDLLQVSKVDLVITDIVMPDQDGIETIIWMRENRPGVPAIAISGDSPKHARLYLSMTQKFGALRTLLKPFNVDALLRTVNEVLLEKPATSEQN